MLIHDDAQPDKIFLFINLILYIAFLFLKPILTSEYFFQMHQMEHLFLFYPLSPTTHTSSWYSEFSANIHKSNNPLTPF